MVAQCRERTKCHLEGLMLNYVNKKKKSHHAPNLRGKPSLPAPACSPGLSVPRFPQLGHEGSGTCPIIGQLSPSPQLTPLSPRALWSLTMVFLSAFWMRYPVTSLLPSSLGGCHSTSALVPHTSFTVTFMGGPAFSERGWVLRHSGSSLLSPAAQSPAPCGSPAPPHTHDADTDGGRVLHVLNLHAQLVLARVGAGRLPHEEHGVRVAGAQVHT